MTDLETVPETDAGAPAVVVPPDVPREWVAAMRLAARIHNTVFVPKAIRGDPASVMGAILTGQELGLGPMQSLRMIHVIEGRPAASAELMRALVNRAGHRLSVVDATIVQVTLTGTRRDTGASATVTWTMADAQRAKLTGNPAWGKYPRSMLLARATSELCRQIFSDVIGGLYTAEESAAIEAQVWEPDSDLIDPVTGDPPAGAVGPPPPGVDPDTGELLDRRIGETYPEQGPLRPVVDEDDADAAWVAEAKGELEDPGE